MLTKFRTHDEFWLQDNAYFCCFGLNCEEGSNLAKYYRVYDNKPFCSWCHQVAMGELGSDKKWLDLPAFWPFLSVEPELLK